MPETQFRRKLLLVFGILFLLFFAGNLTVFAQQKYWVVLKDKAGVTFDPLAYFDQKAIDRRLRQNLPLAEETDKPINQSYFRQVESAVDSVTGSSRWLNAMSCYASGKQIQKLQHFTFVKEIIPFDEKPAVLAAINTKAISITSNLSGEEMTLLKNQVAVFGDSVFRQRNLDGSGLRIAVFDAGFSGVDHNPAFSHIRQRNKIFKTWDFIKNKEYVYSYASHGTAVLSCIGGRLDSQNIGLATGAEFMLARTERMHAERFSEEENWLAALEWADKNGADIINSSLGYTNKRYFKQNMDGRFSFVTRAANLAACKGMLVVNANGNEGSNQWEILGAPADADSVLSVGGIDPETFIHIGFSSFGPTADKRMKPNVAAFGLVMAASPEAMTETQGTSFASPLVAGFAACAWQANRNLTNMELFRKIEHAGNLYPYFDYAHGFGIPQAANFLNGNPKISPTLSFKRTGTQLKIIATAGFTLDTTTFNKGNFPIVPNRIPAAEKAYPGSGNLDEAPSTGNLLYYNFTDADGFIFKYLVVRVLEPEVATLDLAMLPEGTIIKAFYRGYTTKYRYQITP